jgi:hypothetical protein
MREVLRGLAQKLPALQQHWHAQSGWSRALALFSLTGGRVGKEQVGPAQKLPAVPNAPSLILVFKCIPWLLCSSVRLQVAEARREAGLSAYAWTSMKSVPLLWSSVDLFICRLLRRVVRLGCLRTSWTS